MFPSIAPYRDAGEMCNVITTLGIAHPPGYPLYTFLGKIWITIFPLGNTAYKLNIFSALCSSLSTVFFMLTLIIFIKHFLSPNLDKKH